MGKTSKEDWLECVTKKGWCNTKLNDMTEEEREEFARKIGASVEDVVKAYENIEERFKADLKEAFIAHKQRKEKQMEEFVKTARSVAETMGCDMDCIEECARHEDLDGLFLRCKCGKGVIKITPERVNTFQILKEHYGDLQNLTDEEIEAANDAIFQ